MSVTVKLAWSASDSFLYVSSRSLYSAAPDGNASKISTCSEPYDLPFYAVGAISLFSLLADPASPLQPTQCATDPSA